MNCPANLEGASVVCQVNKCDLFKEQIQYLGHIITIDGIAMDLEKIKTIME